MDKVKVKYAQAVNISVRKPTGLSAGDSGDMMVKAALTSAAVGGGKKLHLGTKWVLIWYDTC